MAYLKALFKDFNNDITYEYLKYLFSTTVNFH